MEVILYESGSRGGNFDYSQKLFLAYKKHPEVKSIEWIIPSCASVPAAPGVHKILCDDRSEFGNKLFSRLNFIYRSFANPLRLLRYLRRKATPQFVILNDFEQLTALFWVPLYKRHLKQHHFAVVLHDPDRDAYPPSKSMSEKSMTKMMSIMSLGLFHELLPDKPYYRSNGVTTYLNVPHGQYEQQPADREMTTLLQSVRGGNKLVSIIGNIRMEKNYEMAIQAVAKLPGIKLVIAGAPSSSSVNVDDLRKMASGLGVADRVVFIIKYLSGADMSAVIDASDVILLNYKRSFTSQSGIFNLVAPFKKQVVLSRTASGLASTAARFGIGHVIEADNGDALFTALPQALARAGRDNPGWNEYLRYASWENHVNIVIDAFKTKTSNAV